MTTAVIARHSRNNAARLSAYYAASFLVVGVQLPFWPVWLAGRGLDAHQIAAVFAATIWAKVFTTPLLGALADRLGRRRGVMIALAATSCVFYAALWPVTGFWMILTLCLVAGMAQSALMPLGDSITLAAVRDEGLDYGRVRVWGSITFILAAIGSGWALGLRADAGQGGNQVLGLVLAASTILLAACIAMPSGRAATGKRVRWSVLVQFAADRRFWLFVISAAMLQSSHQLYYGFGTLIWRQYGLSDGVIGVLWAEGVLAEIILFWCSTWLVARLGPLGLMVLGGVAGIVRWSLMGLVPGLAAAAVLQLLHAATFGASHLGAMHFLSRQVPPDAAASAQSLYSALSAGCGSGLVMLAAGALYTAWGGQAYLCMAVLSGVGLLGALWLRRSAR